MNGTSDDTRVNVLILTGAQDAVTVPPGPMDDPLDDDLVSFIREKKSTVLVVDDMPDVADMIGDTLKAGGFDVSVEYGGEAALARLRAGPMPDCLLIDLNMPEVPGDAVMSLLRRSPKYRDLPILVITGAKFRDDGEVPDADFVYVTDPTRKIRLEERRAASMRPGTAAPPANPPVTVLPKTVDPDILIETVRAAVARGKEKKHV